MKKGLVLAMVLSLALVASGLCFAEEVVFSDLPLAKALSSAKEQNKLVLVDIYTDWCVPCKELVKHIFKNPEYAAFINQHFISLRVNAEKGNGPEFLKLYKLPSAYPMVMILDAQGAEIDRICGLFGDKEYFQLLQDYAANRNTLAILLKRLDADRNNPALAVEMAEKYSRRCEKEKALPFLQQALQDEKLKLNPEIHFKLALTLLNMQKFADADRAIKNALALDGENETYKRFQKIISEKLAKH